MTSFNKAIHRAVQQIERDGYTVDVANKTVSDTFQKNSYKPTYQIQDGVKCNCSSYSANGICRHFVLFKRDTLDSLFSVHMFHHTLVQPDYIHDANIDVPTRPRSPGETLQQSSPHRKAASKTEQNKVEQFKLA